MNEDRAEANGSRALTRSGQWLAGHKPEEREVALRQQPCEDRGDCVIEICDRVIESPENP